MARVNINQNRKVLLAHKLAGAHIRKTTNYIIAGARILAPRGSHMSGSGSRHSGLQLGQSLRIESESSLTMIVERVGSDKNYAATVHQGSSPHYIHGRGKKLKFEWERGNIQIRARGRRGRVRGRAGPGGNFFFFVTVHHPGNKRPVRFLTTPMHLYGRLYGFRTTSTPVSRSRLP
jgi:hypothetical protein